MGRFKERGDVAGISHSSGCFSSQGKGLARTGTSEVSKRRKLKEELASPSAVLLESPDRWALIVWACRTWRAHLETRLARCFPVRTGRSTEGGSASPGGVGLMAERGLPEPSSCWQSSEE